MTAPPPPPTATSTALGKLEIIKYTKHRILPNPDSSELAQEEENSATRVLAAAIYLKIKNMFFDETSSRVEIATAFKCNISQLTKAVMGVHYKGGPHRYKPKQKTGDKRSSTDQSQQPTKNQKPRKHTPRHLKRQLHHQRKSNRAKLSLKTHFRQSLAPALSFL